MDTIHGSEMEAQAWVVDWNWGLRLRARDPTVLVPGKHTIVCDQSKDYNLIYYNQTKRRLRWTQHTAYSFSRSSSAGDITHHDCDQPRPSQITQNDFVYVLKGSEVVEQGYRVDLEVPSQAGEIESEFRRMMSAQGDGFPVRDDDEIEELGRYDLPEIEVDEVLARYCIPIEA